MCGGMDAADEAWIAETFARAKADFFQSLKHRERYDFSHLTTAQEVYEAAEEIESQQSKTRTLSALRRIDPYLNGLQEYCGVIDTFAQSKADLLCLIWGPLKLVLQAATSLTSTFRKVVEVLAEIGRVLPQFEAFTSIFKQNRKITYGLFLFYRNILDFHAALLNFFANKGLNTFLEALWPNLRAEIDSIKTRITQDGALITSNATLEHVKSTEKFRQLAVDEFQKSEKFRDEEKFLSLSQLLESRSCKTKLHDIASVIEHQASFGDWLSNAPPILQWLDITDVSYPYIWLQGIPGAGKTFLAAHIIRCAQVRNNAMLYAFIQNGNQGITKPLTLWHSLIFQLVCIRREFCPLVYEYLIIRFEELTSDKKFIQDLLCQLLQSFGPVHIVIDGLDEMSEPDRASMLASLLEITKSQSIRLMLSSRLERDIEIKLNAGFETIRVDHGNAEDIRLYIRNEGMAWMLELQEHGADAESCGQIGKALEEIVNLSNGMFLYAKLVLDVAKSHDNLTTILGEMHNLPNGLTDAYGRVLSRLQSLVPGLRRSAARVLMWTAGAMYPLRESEILQALSVYPENKDFSGQQRKAWLDIRKACGPIIELVNSKVQFVHFTAKEYFFGIQSGPFLSLLDADQEIALTCVTYLTYRSLDPVFSGSSNLSRHREILQEQILKGDFILLQYAAAAWLHHISSLATRIESSKVPENHRPLQKNLSEFINVRQSARYADRETTTHVSIFESLTTDPETQSWLNRSHEFQNKLWLGQLSHDDDPLRVYSALMQFRNRLDSMRCGGDHQEGCTCAKLVNMYGSSTFRCTYVSCSYFFRGFDTLLERERHLSIHLKPYKCSVADCLFADLGFSTSDELSRHNNAVHAESLVHRNKLPAYAAEHILASNLYLILEDSIRDDSIEIVQAMLPRARADATCLAAPEQYWKLFILACAKASGKMLDYLLQNASENEARTLDLNQALAAAIDSRNYYTAQRIVQLGADPNTEIALGDVAAIIGSENIPRGRKSRHETWRRWQMRPIDRAFGLLESAIAHHLVSNGANLDLFTGFGFVNIYGIYANCDEDDILDRLSQLEFLFQRKSKRLLEHGLKYALEETAPAVVRFCMANGADPFQPIGQDKTVFSQFLGCFNIHKSSADMKVKYQMLKFLVQKGKDQGLEEAMCNLGREEPLTVRAVEIYAGVKWEDVVRETVRAS